MQLHDHYAKSDVTYEVLDVLEFTSQRRRMSVVVRDKASGAVRLPCKGKCRGDIGEIWGRSGGDVGLGAPAVQG